MKLNKIETHFNFMKYFKNENLCLFIFCLDLSSHQIIQFKRKLPPVLYVHGCNREFLRENSTV